MDAADAVGDAVAVDMEFVADFLNIAVQPYIGYGRIGQLGVSALCDKKGKGVLQSGNGGVLDSAIASVIFSKQWRCSSGNSILPSL